MKANEAPERIWIDPTIDLPKLSGHIDEDSVEYVRIDAFMKKVCTWLEENADSYTWYNEFEGESGMINEFIEDFKNYMKNNF